MIELNLENWSQVIENNESVLVDVYGPGCGPCITMESRLRELEKTYGSKVVFTKIEAISNLECLAEYGLKVVPTVLYFKACKLVNREVGKKSIEELELSIMKYLY